jgi:hypothetical protein
LLCIWVLGSIGYTVVWIYPGGGGVGLAIGGVRPCFDRPLALSPAHVHIGPTNRLLFIISLAHGPPVSHFSSLFQQHATSAGFRLFNLGLSLTSN